MRILKLIDDKGRIKRINLLDAEPIEIDEEQDIYLIRIKFQCLNCQHVYHIDVVDVNDMIELVNKLNSNDEFNLSELPVDITCPSCTIKMYLN